MISTIGGIAFEDILVDGTFFTALGCVAVLTYSLSVAGRSQPLRNITYRCLMTNWQPD
jgi:hypothetical protein